MADNVSNVFSKPSSSPFSTFSPAASTRCVHCLNESWGRVIREVFEGMLEGTVPINLTLNLLHRKLVTSTEEEWSSMSMTPYRYADGSVPLLSTLRNHIRAHEWELWERVKNRKAELGCRW